LASVFFQASITFEEIYEKHAFSTFGFDKDKVKILIVPGHDEVNFGTAYKKLLKIP